MAEHIPAPNPLSLFVARTSRRALRLRLDDDCVQFGVPRATRERTRRDVGRRARLVLGGVARRRVGSDAVAVSESNVQEHQV